MTIKAQIAPDQTPAQDVEALASMASELARQARTYGQPHPTQAYALMGALQKWIDRQEAS
ncbi:MAG TPA: hypothetical protein VFZ00_20495 [Solirubrobacter sp.]|nr:hypothetical protein [Solirubrobacter sp.]